MHLTQAGLNNGLWAAALLLQGALLVLLALRGHARRMPWFTALIAFYLLRMLLLRSIGPHGAALLAFQSSLAMGDLLLQLAVAWELLTRLQPHGVRPARSAGWTLLAAVAIADLGAWLAGRLAEPHPGFPLDRGEVFTSLLIVLVWLVLLRGRRSRPAERMPARVLSGFAAYGAVSLLADLGRGIAFAHRDGPSYRAASYAPALMYLLVLLAWVALAAEAAVPSKRPEEKVSDAEELSGFGA